MKQGPNQSKIEQFFHKTLRALRREPTDDLWMRIEADLPHPPASSFWQWRSWLSLAVLLMIVGGSMVEYLRLRRQLSGLQTTVAAQDHLIHGLRSEVELLSQANWPKIIDPSQKTQLDEQLSEPHKQAGIDITSTGLSSSPIFQATKPPKPLSVFAFDAKDFNLSTVLDFSQIKILTDVGNAGQLPLVATSGSNPSDISVSMTAFEYPAPTLAHLKADLLGIDPHKINNTRVEIYAGAYQTYPKLSGNNFFDWNLSSEMGVNLVFEFLPNWDFAIGVGFSEMIIDDELSEELLYAGANEPTLGVSLSNYDVDLKTNYGDFYLRTQLVSQRFGDGNDLEPGDPFLLSLQMRERIKHVNIPFTLRYRLHWGRYGLQLKAGVIQRFLYDEVTRVESVYTNQSRLYNEVTYVQRGLDDLNLSTMDAVFGAGVNYRLSSRHNLRLDGIFIQSFEEVYRQTKPYAFGLQLGFQSRLRQKN